MPKFFKNYLNQMKNKFGYRATWEPNRPMEIGAIGKFHRGIFVQYSTLNKKKIPMETQTSTGKNMLDFSTSEGVKITTKGEGDPVPANASRLADANAGFVIEFSKENSILFKALNTKNTKIVNIEELEEGILNLYKKGKWDKKYVVIAELIEAEATTAIISKSSNSRIELQAKADVGSEDLKITNASLELGMVAEKDIATKVIAETNASPLYLAMGLKPRLFGSDHSAKLGIKKLREETDFQLDKIDFEEFELEDI